VHFYLRAKFYPENVVEELIQDITRVREMFTTLVVHIRCVTTV